MVKDMMIKGRFLFRRIGQNHYAVYPDPDKFDYSALTMTGSDVTEEISIPFFHRIIKLVLIHMDSSYDASTVGMDVTLELKQGKSNISHYFTDKLFHEEDIVAAEIIEKFGEGFEYEPRTWSLTLNTTNTHLVIPVLYIQKLEGGG